MRLATNRRFGFLVGGLLAPLCFTTAMRADIDAWYELVSPAGPGTGVASVSQGAAGQPLVIFTDQATGDIQLTIQFVAAVDPADELYAYSIDLIAPSAANVGVDSLTFLGPFDSSDPYTLGDGPGALIDDATQLTFGAPQSGTMEFLEFTLKVQRPPTDDVELFTGIGQDVWGPDCYSPCQVLVRFADADPIDPTLEFDATTSLPNVANRPSIIIKQYVAPPATGACCIGGNTCALALTEADCTGQFGMWQGADSTACANCPAPPVTGACCLNGATCRLGVTQAACSSLGGVWQGNYSSRCANCTPAPKPSTQQDQTTTPPADETSQPSNQEEESAPTRIDRQQLFHDLAVIFAIPYKDVHPVAILPLKFFGLFGLNASIVLGITDFYALPFRWIAFQLTFAILDHVLP